MKWKVKEWSKVVIWRYNEACIDSGRSRIGLDEGSPTLAIKVDVRAN